MVRANRYFVAGNIWHITQRCHKKEFLLKFVRDRRKWRGWLFQAKKRYGLRVLDYMVTSNHIHLLAYDEGKKNAIPRSMQLISGRTAQEYNQRKSRKGAFWEDRYHATAIDNGFYLIRCLIYIDLNMVRAGKVIHPSQWNCCGYNDIQNIPKRKKILDYVSLINLLGLSSIEELKDSHQRWIQEALKKENQVREEKWTKSLAVGSQLFIESIQEKLGIKGQYRIVSGDEETMELREEACTYLGNFAPKNGYLRAIMRKNQD